MASNGQYISQPVKFLGKLFVDRMPSERPDQNLLFKAVAIIQRQAPTKGKRQVAFFTTDEAYDGEMGTIKPAALCGRLRDGTMAFVQPMITIVSIGHTNKSFVYVTVEPKDGDTQGMLRFWIYAFSCRSKDMGVKLATHMISCCAKTRNMYRQRRAMGVDYVRMSKMGNSAAPSGIAPDYGALITDEERNDPHSDITMALEAASAMQSMQSEAQNEHDDESEMKTTTVNEDDFTLATTALTEMYDLDCALQRYRLPEAFRTKLMDAWQKGYDEGGSITKSCSGDPAGVMINTAMVQV